jgi:hypothetical protein
MVRLILDWLSDTQLTALTSRVVGSLGSGIGIVRLVPSAAGWPGARIIFLIYKMMLMKEPASRLCCEVCNHPCGPVAGTHNKCLALLTGMVSILAY